MKKCDICGKDDSYFQSVLDSYKTEDIKEVCHECADEINNHLMKLRKITQKMNVCWLKRFMRNLKKKARL